MKYALLQQWVNEMQTLRDSIQRVTLEPDRLLVHLMNKGCFGYYYKGNEPLCILLDDKNCKDTPESVKIWHQLDKTEFSSITLAENDRIVYTYFQQKGIYQDTTVYCLIFECMPPKANVILTQLSEGKLKVLDALNKYTYADNPQRQILPGLPYEAPHTGFTPVREIAQPPFILHIPDKGDISFDTVNDYLIAYEQQVLRERERRAHILRLKQYWQREHSRIQRKLQAQQQDMQNADKEQLWLTYSELLKVNLQSIRKGDASFTGINYYDPDMPSITIPLQTDKSPQDNLKIYLKKYHKAKNGRVIIGEQLAQTRAELTRIEEILQDLEQGNWQQADLIGTDSANAAARIKQTDNLFRLPVNRDWEIIIGRKAKENDFVTTQLGKPNDWWFHTRIYHGSHILLRNYGKKTPPTSLVELCCSLAAWFSKARHSQNVPVDYTQIRYVRKPRKSAPGYVIYTHQKTVFADPVDVNCAKEVLKQYED